ncbi:hypothetical protein TWF694_003180 [Orbilia ellipsospora]|uniref:AA9 family lytic polysaccharide monooxygenase n=1 Tax=Orbilia ellipsospora TaxID=2528407 RepID=A0AAV9X3C4_9PEZI
MKYTPIFNGLLLATAAAAHHVLTNFMVDDIHQTNVLRQPGTVSPIINPNDQNLACGTPPDNGQGMRGTEKAVIQPGSNLTFEWHTNWSASVSGPEGVTDISHKGPCAIYMRKVDDSVTAIANDLRQPGWFKIWEDGVDKDGVFCTTRMRKNGGFFSGTVPKHLENGDYLVRAETVTLNNAEPPEDQPQWYIGCAQITLKNSKAPFVTPYTIPIPSGDYANLNMPGLRYNIWYPTRSNFSDYGPVPGPAVFNGGENSFESPNNGRTQTSQIDLMSTSSLPNCFSTIPWPQSSCGSTSDTITSTITVTTKIPTCGSTTTVTVKLTGNPIYSTIDQTTTSAITLTTMRTVRIPVTRTIYLTGTPTTFANPPIYEGSRQSGHHYKTVTVTNFVSITKIVYPNHDPSNTEMEAEPAATKDATSTMVSTSSYQSRVFGPTFQYRH